MVARRIKSLRHNLIDGKDIPSHREHRSKRGRNNKTHDVHSKRYKRKIESLKLKELNDELA
jgi:hypothetical protein